MYGLCADVHAHAWSMFSKMIYDEEGELVNNRLKSIMDEFDRLCAMTTEKGGKNVYIAGDLFHVRGNLKTSVLNYVMFRMRKSARDAGVQVRIMPGNHDLEDSEVTWLGNATMLMDDAGDHDLEDQLILMVNSPSFFDDDNVAVVPWRNTRSGLEEAINEVKDLAICSGVDLSDVDLHLHTGINGVIIGMPDHGWSPHELAEFGFKRVFSGHYHNFKPFEIVRDMGDSCHVVSIGSLTHQSWRDVGTKSGFLLVDRDDFSHYESEAPEFIDFDETSDLYEAKGNYVRVRDIELEEADVRKLRDGLHDAGALGVSIQVVSKSKIVTRGGAKAGKTVTMESSIEAWVKEADVKHKKEVVNEALDVLSEARAAT